MGGRSRPRDCWAIREAPISSGKSSGIGQRLVAILLIMSVFAFTGAGVARAEPAKITKAKQEADALQAKLQDLGGQVDAAVEDYDYAKAQLKKTNAAAQKTQTKLDKAQKDLAAAEQRLTERIVQIYKDGQTSVLDTLMGASSFSDLINRYDMLQRLSKQDNEILVQVDTYRGQVADRRAELAQQAKEQKALTNQAAAAQKKVLQKQADVAKQLKGKESQVAQLEKEWKAQQAALAAQAKEAARLAALKAQQAAANHPHTVSGPGIQVSVPSSASGSKVIQVAVQYIGVPYVWAGADPSGFDCSGFVMYVYGKLGIDLPHSSRMMSEMGSAVSDSQLQPGDLVFFGSPVHHVGIYVGDGKMINSPYTGASVRIESVWRSSYAGARRIID